jgi:hypothetical protein
MEPLWNVTKKGSWPETLSGDQSDREGGPSAELRPLSLSFVRGSVRCERTFVAGAGIAFLLLGAALLRTDANSRAGTTAAACGRPRQRDPGTTEAATIAAAARRATAPNAIS